VSQPPPDRIREQLEKIVFSKTLRKSNGPKKLLGYVVRTTLDGLEVTQEDVAHHALEMGDRFDSTIDANVRTAAKNLRKKLEVYYATEGASDQIKIDIPKGGYVPEFSWASARTTENAGDKPVPPDPPDRRHVYLAGLGAAFAAGEKQWDEVLRTTEQLMPMTNEPLLDQERRHLAMALVLRFGALCELRRFEQVVSEFTTASLSESFWGNLYPNGLIFPLVALECIGDVKRAGELRSKLWELAIERERGLLAAKRIVECARLLAKQSLHPAALTLLEGLVDRIRKSTEPGLRAEYAEARYLTLAYLLELNRPGEGLQVYHQIEQEFVDETDEDIIWAVAWSGTAATRALRTLDRHADADVLASSLQDRFGTRTGTNTREALAWALIERCKTCFSTGDFDAAVVRNSQIIEEWNSSANEPWLEWPLAWAYAYKVFCLRKAKRYDEAINTCDDFVARFGNSSNMDVQYEVVWTLMEKVNVLRRSKRLAASVAVAKALAVRFAEATDQRIVSQLAWAIAAEGDAFLCEAKLLRQNGLEEDVVVKLHEALRCFTEATQRDPAEPGHFGSRSYVEFLLGQTAAAEETFATALSLETDGRFDEGDWTELSMFPIPEDNEFSAAIQRWREQRTGHI
jgi:tetratricopeptide (TPR) repeat protein